MNIKNRNVKRRIKKYYKDLARWGTPEHKVSHLQRDWNRHLAKIRSLIN